jgi:RNA polymerase sigma factor (sigma-70 family)
MRHRNRKSNLPHSSDHLFVQRCADDWPGHRSHFIEEYTEIIQNAVRSTLQRFPAVKNCSPEDMTQDVFVSLFENNGHRLRSFEGRNSCSFKTWLRVVACRRTLNAVRRNALYGQRESYDHIEQMEDRAPLAEDALWIKEAVLLIRKEVQKLKLRDRLIFRMIYEDEYSYDQVAAACRINKGALYTRVYRIRDRLRGRAESEGLLKAE